MGGDNPPISSLLKNFKIYGIIYIEKMKRGAENDNRHLLEDDSILYT